MTSTTADRFTLAVIMGSVRDGRFGPVVTDWFARTAGQRDDVSVDVIDLLDPGALNDRVGAADAIVVVTPEYNHGYPGELKVALDTLYEECRAKPVGFVAYGGISGGLRAVEQLRAVFAELHAVTIRDTVSFHLAGDRFGGDGNPLDGAGTSRAATVLLDQLAWWAHALRAARTARPYVA